MHYRSFGNTGLYVSELCLGTMTFGGKGFWEVIGKAGAVEVEAFITKALDSGVNFIDTADVYSEGESERLVGEAIRRLGCRRDELILATKVRGRTGPGANQVGLSRGHIFTAVDASLRRLRTDYIDLYQIHGVDFDTPIEETVQAMSDLVHIGKVRYIGYSNLPAWQAMKAIGHSQSHDCARFVSAQMYYSIASRDIERETVPLAQDQKLAILSWSPLSGGLLSGKFDLENPGPHNARRTLFDFPRVDRARTIEVLKVMRSIAQELHVSVARVALAWILTRPFVTSVIIGAKTLEQLEDNLEATKVQFAPEQVARLDAASELPAEYPGWMVEWQNRERRPGVRTEEEAGEMEKAA